jgi:cephalosporin-C deacetylase-like acetyl esterase
MRPFLLLGLAGALAAADLTITADHRDGTYAVGETVTWTIAGLAADAAPAYTVKSGGRTLTAQGTLHPVDGTATVQASLPGPGTLLLTVATGDKTSAWGGAAVDWPHIAAAAPAPVDFDDFWKEKIATLQAIPADPVLESVPSGNPRVDLWKISMANINGSRINGYLARPTGTTACPAQLVVQWAGVYPLDKNWAVSQANHGWLTLNILAHDLPVDREKAYYDSLKEGALKDYSHIGAHDRERSYFLRMYLSCYRAADYLAGRSDWNRQTLLVAGGSQGGLQAIVTAALHPAVTVATADVPAGCDHAGGLVGRAPGWPNWVAGATGTEAEARLKAAAYFDVVNFASRVKAPVLVGVGLIDTVCPPAGVIAMFHQLGGPKRLVIMPTAEHAKGREAFQPVRNAWFLAARDGKPLPRE